MSDLVEVCYYCGKIKDCSSVIRLILENENLAENYALSIQPCDSCKEIMIKNIIVIAVKAETENDDTPQRIPNKTVIVPKQMMHKYFPKTKDCNSIYMNEILFDKLFTDAIKMNTEGAEHDCSSIRNVCEKQIT